MYDNLQRNRKSERLTKIVVLQRFHSLPIANLLFHVLYCLCPALELFLHRIQTLHHAPLLGLEP